MISEKVLCADWLSVFPLLKRYKSGRKLLCWSGVVVYGIELEKVRFDDSSYRPNFVAMCLLSNPHEFSINQVLFSSRNAQYKVPYAKHDEQSIEAISLMKKQAPILLQSSPSPADFVNLYKEHVKQQIANGESPLSVWLSLIQICAYYDEADLAKLETEAMFSSISESTMSLMGGDNFKQFLQEESSLSIEKLNDRMLSNLKKGGWDMLPVVNN